MKQIAYTALAAALLVHSLPSLAHVSFAAANAYAGTSHIATANIPHGCSDESGGHLDTIKVDIDIPSGFTSVRPMDSTFGPATVTKDSAGNVTRISWIKNSDALPEDDHFYQFSFRGTLPVETLQFLTFVTTQTCPGGISKVWEGSTAPKIAVLPVRKPGWNKYTAQSDISLDSVKAYFGDAEIVWSNGQAYSSNPVTAELIASPLQAIPLGSEYWVKY